MFGQTFARPICLVLLLGLSQVTWGSFWHRDEFCAKYDIDARHNNRHSDDLGHGLEVDVDRLVK